MATPDPNPPSKFDVAARGPSFSLGAGPVPATPAPTVGAVGSPPAAPAPQSGAPSIADALSSYAKPLTDWVDTGYAPMRGAEANLSNYMAQGKYPEAFGAALGVGGGAVLGGANQVATTLLAPSLAVTNGLYHVGRGLFGVGAADAAPDAPAAPAASAVPAAYQLPKLDAITSAVRDAVLKAGPGASDTDLAKNLGPGYSIAQGPLGSVVSPVAQGAPANVVAPPRGGPTPIPGFVTMGNYLTRGAADGASSVSTPGSLRAQSQTRPSTPLDAMMDNISNMHMTMPQFDALMKYSQMANQQEPAQHLRSIYDYLDASDAADLKAGKLDKAQYEKQIVARARERANSQYGLYPNPAVIPTTAQ